VIIGIDPGLMTGVFTWHPGMGKAPALPVCEQYQIPANEVIDYLWGLMGDWRHYWLPDNIHVAIEKYIITSRTAKLSQQSDALEVTGIVKAVSHLHGVTDVRQYLKANLKFASDDILRGVGWYSPKLRHANDAARQAFALLKDVDYPRWSELVRGAKMETKTEG
jgi:hypothetical protein